jgi:hypothetical protein
MSDYFTITVYPYPRHCCRHGRVNFTHFQRCAKRYGTMGIEATAGLENMRLLADEVAA